MPGRLPGALVFLEAALAAGLITAAGETALLQLRLNHGFEGRQKSFKFANS